MGRLLPTGAFDTLLTVTSSVAPGVLGALFVAVLFRYTPDAEVAWRSVWLGAVVSMLMLVIGAWAYGIYLDNFGLRSAAGVAGTVFLFLVLVYYTVTILLYGIEIVKYLQTRLETLEGSHGPQS